MVSPPFARFNPNREFSKYQKFLQKSGCFRDKLTLKGMGKSIWHQIGSKYNQTLILQNTQANRFSRCFMGFNCIFKFWVQYEYIL